MSIDPLKQVGPIDVVDWTPDAEFAVFPVGARAKEAYFAPSADSVPAVVKPLKRYLFKRSKKSYPDQFWGEIVAYRVGCLMGIPVPAAFYGINSSTHVAAALIEWFYEPNELFMHGGDFLVHIRSGYDREVGEQHNLEDIRALSSALKNTQDFTEDWRQWWSDALLFDALIGNTDRHQDNWGMIFGTRPDEQARRKVRMAPMFDNGTSLGHERFPERVVGWTAVEFERYVGKGRHHVKWSLQDPSDGHVALLKRALESWPATVPLARARLEFEEGELEASIADLLQLPGPQQLTQARFDFILRLLRLRFQRLKRLIDDIPTVHS
jgi:hypothetical protein